jgi:hypothetical protein
MLTFKIPEFPIVIHMSGLSSKMVRTGELGLHVHLTALGCGNPLLQTLSQSPALPNCISNKEAECQHLPMPPDLPYLLVFSAWLCLGCLQRACFVLFIHVRNYDERAGGMSQVVKRAPPPGGP